MSGDVFGNGMLLSEHIRLVAAFDHRHIFLDPDPDAGRRRTPSAAGCSTCPARPGPTTTATLITEGGGIYPRTAKSVPISAAGGAALGLRRGRHAADARPS